MKQIPPLTPEQLSAIKALWDATDPYAEDPEDFSEESAALVAARDTMGEAFPATHPIYRKNDYERQPKHRYREGATMEPHQQRVVAERDELVDRLTKLMAFIESPAFDAVAAAETKLLLHQVAAMQGYMNVLDARIGRWL